MKKFVSKCFAVCVTLAAMGCASALPFRASPDLKTKAPTIKNVVLLPPKVEIFELGTATQEKIDEWCVQGTTNVSEALQTQLKERPGISVRSFQADSVAPDLKSSLDDTQTLFDAVNSSVVTHTYSENNDRFKDKVKNFDYSLGQETSQLSGDADALLLVRGVDHISSGGRKAAQAGAMVVGALFGLAIAPQGGATELSIALVDAKTGSLLWHTYTSVEGDYDLRDLDSAADIVKRALKTFPLK